MPHRARRAMMAQRDCHTGTRGCHTGARVATRAQGLALSTCHCTQPESSTGTQWEGSSTKLTTQGEERGLRSLERVTASQSRRKGATALQPEVEAVALLAAGMAGIGIGNGFAVGVGGGEGEWLCSRGDFSVGEASQSGRHGFSSKQWHRRARKQPARWL